MLEHDDWDTSPGNATSSARSSYSLGTPNNGLTMNAVTRQWSHGSQPMQQLIPGFGLLGLGTPSTMHSPWAGSPEHVDVDESPTKSASSLRTPVPLPTTTVQITQLTHPTTNEAVRPQQPGTSGALGTDSSVSMLANASPSKLFANSTLFSSASIQPATTTGATSTAARCISGVTPTADSAETSSTVIKPALSIAGSQVANPSSVSPGDGEITRTGTIKSNRHGARNTEPVDNPNYLKAQSSLNLFQPANGSPPNSPGLLPTGTATLQLTSPSKYLLANTTNPNFRPNRNTAPVPNPYFKPKVATATASEEVKTTPMNATDDTKIVAQAEAHTSSRKKTPVHCLRNLTHSDSISETTFSSSSSVETELILGGSVSFNPNLFTFIRNASDNEMNRTSAFADDSDDDNDKVPDKLFTLSLEVFCFLRLQIDLFGRCISLLIFSKVTHHILPIAVADKSEQHLVFPCFLYREWCYMVSPIGTRFTRFSTP